MQREFVAAPEFWTVGDAIDHMRETGEDLPEIFFNVYIIDTAFKPIGYVPVSQLMRGQRDMRLSDLMTDTIVKIDQSSDQEEAAYLFEKYNLISAPVINDEGRLVGMMTVDDIIEIIQDENKEDILALAGVSDAGLADTAMETVRARAPWLFINLLTAVLASLVIARFDYAITEIVALAVLMPIVASMGGNAGTQALTVAELLSFRHNCDGCRRIFRIFGYCSSYSPLGRIRPDICNVSLNSIGPPPELY